MSVGEFHSVLGDSRSKRNNRSDRHPSNMADQQQLAVDQGFAWIVLVASFLSQTIIYGVSRGIQGILYVIVLDHLDFRSPSQVALGIGLQTSMMFFISPLAGVLVNLYGCRRIGLLGSVLSSVGIILTMVSTNVYCMILSLGALAGSGFGLSYIAAMTAVTLHLDKYRHVAFGVATSGAGIGILTFPIITQELYNTYTWQGCLLILGGISFHQLVFSATFPSKPHTSRENPGQQPSQQRIGAVNLWIFKNIQYVFVGFSMLFYTKALSMIYVHLSVYTEELGFSPTYASLLYTTIGVGGFLGRYIYIEVLHWADPPPVLLHMLGAIACVCAGFLLPITSGYISLQVYAAVFGLLTSSFGSLMPLIISDILGPAMIASGYGFALAFNGLGQIVGPPLADLLAEWKNTYATSLYLSGTSFSVSTICLIYPTVQRFRERK